MENVAHRHSITHGHLVYSTAPARGDGGILIHAVRNPMSECLSAAEISCQCAQACTYLISTKPCLSNSLEEQVLHQPNHEAAHLCGSFFKISSNSALQISVAVWEALENQSKRLWFSKVNQSDSLKWGFLIGRGCVISREMLWNVGS